MTRVKRYLTAQSRLCTLYFPHFSISSLCLSSVGKQIYYKLLQCPLSQVVKLQNKAVLLMEPLTHHYETLHLMKFPDIVKLYTCLLFYDYLHNEKFLVFHLSNMASYQIFSN